MKRIGLRLDHLGIYILQKKTERDNLFYHAYLTFSKCSYVRTQLASIELMLWPYYDLENFGDALRKSCKKSHFIACNDNTSSLIWTLEYR